MNLIKKFSWVILLLVVSPVSYAHISMQHSVESGSGLLMHVLTQPGHYSLLVLVVLLLLFHRQIIHLIGRIFKDDS